VRPALRFERKGRSAPRRRFKGGGEFLLGGGGGEHHRQRGPIRILYNTDNTITGSGTIGDKHLLVVNEQGGTIDAADTGR